MRVLFEIQRPVSVRQLNVLTRALCALNVDWLRRHPNAPTLKASGVRYRTQDIGFEFFKMVPEIIAAGSGDCDQLAAWRAAEIRVRYGVRAMPEVVQISPRMFHAFVRFPNGRAEDISAHLGMRVPRRFVVAGRAKLANKIREKTRAKHAQRISSGGVFGADLLRAGQQWQAGWCI